MHELQSAALKNRSTKDLPLCLPDEWFQFFSILALFRNLRLIFEQWPQKVVLNYILLIEEILLRGFDEFLPTSERASFLISATGFANLLFHLLEVCVARKKE